MKAFRKTYEYEEFLELITNQTMGIWVFYFSDDLKRIRYEIGTFKMKIVPYWIKSHRILSKNKTWEFNNPEEMLEAKLFDGKSLKERWDKVVIIRDE